MDWHKPLQEKVQFWLESGRLPHGILLTGPTGVGKRQFSDWLAQQLLGTNSETRALLDAGTHPDLLRVQPEEGKKQISVDKIRDVSRKATLTSQLGGKQLIEIFPAEAMNRNAANSLLKTLEEPTRDTIILLIAEHAAGLLPTIKSRCQQLNIACPATEEAGQWLLQHDVPADQHALLLKHSAGAPLAALDLFQQNYVELSQGWLQQLQQLIDNQLNVTALAKNLLDHPFATILNWLTWHTIDQLHEPEQIKRYSAANMYRYLDALYAASRLQHGSLNEQLLLENLLLPWGTQFKLIQDLPS